ncbi:MAG: pyridoxal phosphate-dependent aminotransferase [Vicinamibacteria bacterium]
MKETRLHLSDRVGSVQVSPTVATAARAVFLRSQGREILDFSVGEPDQSTPERIRKAASEAMNRGETRYVPSLGVPGLRKAVAERYRIDDGVTIDPSEVAITLGGKQAYSLACETILNPGDEIVIPTPFWPTFSEAPRIVEGVPVFAPLDAKKGFAFDPDLIMKKVRPKTRALILNSPSNPTGQVVSEKGLTDIAKSLKVHAPDAFLIYDDTYARMLYVKGTKTMLPRVREILGDRFMIAGTASKTYCMTGWRIGWLMASKPVIAGLSALISHQTQCAASFAQFGAIEALSGPQDFVGELVEEYRVRRDLVVSALNAMPGVKCRTPSGAFYAFPDITGLLSKDVPDALTFATRLLDDRGVATVAGEGFGCPGFIRISFARSQDELKRGLAAIAGFAASLHPKAALRRS